MSMGEEGTIRRVPQEVSGVKDGVELMAKCTITNFTVTKKEVTGIGNQCLAKCKLMTSFENGTVSLSVHNSRPFMVTVRLDEMMALLKEAADCNKESYPKEEKKDE